MLAEFKQLIKYKIFHDRKAPGLSSTQKQKDANMINLIDEKKTVDTKEGAGFFYIIFAGKVIKLPSLHWPTAHQRLSVWKAVFLSDNNNIWQF